MNKDKFRKVEALLSEARKNLNEAMTSQHEELDEFEAREAYLSEFNRVCERFGIEVDVELDEDRSKDEVYSEWNDHVNMSASELKKWSKNPCSREASVDPQAVIKRNLRLLERNKEDWTSNDVEDAERTISFISRMKAQQPDSPREGPHGCPSEWAISLLNWAFNPFDSVPTPSSEVKEDLEPVEEVNLSSELQERRNIKEAEMLAEQVWVMKDVLEEFNQEFQDLAMSLEEEKEIEEVRNKREQVVKNIELMMSKLEPPVEAVKNNSVEELQEQKVSYEFSPVPDQVLYENRDMAEERAADLGLEGVHMHPVIFREPAEIPDELMEDVTVYHMAGSTHGDWVSRVEPSEEMSESRKASRVVHGDQEKHLGAEEDDDSVQVPPVAIHKVESGSKVEVSEDVEEVLDELWEQNSE
jgi:hypothetical protein